MGRMNEFKKPDSMKYLAVFLITIIIFGSGVYLGSYLSGKKLEQFRNIEDSIRLETLGAEVQYQILIGNPCQFVNSTPLTQELYDLSEKLDHLENIYGEDDENVMQLKEQYSLLEVRHWLYTRKTNEECGTNHTTIVYFYSNEGDCDRCEEQGYILTYLRKKNPDLRVYSFDINLDNPAVNTIRNIYDVEEAPTVIIGTRVFKDFTTRDQLETYLGMK